jgi:hypothetical protein
MLQDWLRKNKDLIEIMLKLAYYDNFLYLGYSACLQLYHRGGEAAYRRSVISKSKPSLHLLNTYPPILYFYKIHLKLMKISISKDINFAAL